MIKQYMRFVCFFIACLTCGLSVHAQNYWFKYVGIENGLAASQVNHICKDKQGFVWFGTSAGLDRFDGVSIKHFQSNSASVNSLPDSYIRNVQEAYDGLLWLRTNGGYVILDPVTQSFDQSVSQHLSMIAANLDPEIVFFDKNKNLWIYDKGNAVYYYKYKQQLVYTLPIGDEKSGLKEGNISGFCNTTDGVLAVYTNGRVVCINGEQQRVLWSNDVIANNTTQEDEYSVFADLEGGICVYGETSSYFYDKKQSKWYTSLSQLVKEWDGECNLTNELVTGISMTSRGDVWVCTDRAGMVVLRPSERRVLAHLVAGADRSIASNNLETVHIDDTDLVWIGSSHSGVSYYAPNLYMFEVAHVGDVYGMSDDGKGGMWFATHGNGLVYRNIHTGNTLSYTTANGLNDNMLSCVLSANDGTVWAGSNRFGLNRLTGNGTQTIRSTGGGKGLLDDNVQTLEQDKFGNIWIGTRKGGLQCLNPKTGSFSNFNVSNKKLLSDNVTSLSCRGGQLVAGTMNGIMVLNLSSNKATTYNGTLNGDKHFASNAITQVFLDSRGLIWVGSRDGLNVLDLTTDQLSEFDMTNGLPSNVICGIAEDQKHEIWITTTKGVCRIAVQDGSESTSRYTYNFYRFEMSDGLQGIEFNMGAILAAKSGRIFMGGQNGINWIRNIESKPRKRTLHVILSRLEIDGQPIEVGQNYNGRVILPKMLNQLDELVLRSSDKNLQITLGVDDYNHAEHPRYVYQVEGAKDVWLPVTGDGHTLSLAYLNRGVYTLRVKATLDNGQTLSEEHVIKLVVIGPWYSTWWFIALIVILLAVVVWGLYKLYNNFITFYRRRKREVSLLQKKQDEMDVIAKDLRSNVVSMIPQLGLLMLNQQTPEQKEMLNGLQHSARQMLASLNQLKDNQSVLVGDEGVDRGIQLGGADAGEVLIGDDGPVGEAAVEEEFLVSDEGIISVNGVATLAATLRYNVFMVEPDADMLEFVSDCLKSTYTIHTFTSAEECWNAMSEIRPSIIVCAENLADMSGSMLCERVKNERSYERIPFILTTDGVLSQSELVFKHITLMADDYIPSPYNLQSLIVRINLLLGEKNEGETTVDDTLRGAIAMNNAVNSQLKYTIDQYIHENISRKDLNFEELCQVLNVTRTLLFRKVERVTGCSPIDYIRNVRLSEATHLLESGFVTPAEVADELGFGNLATFSRFFQAKYGVLPSQYAEGERKTTL